MPAYPRSPHGGNINTPRRQVPNQTDPRYYIQGQTFVPSNQPVHHRGNQNDNASWRYPNQNSYQHAGRNGPVPAHVSNHHYNMSHGGFSPAHRDGNYHVSGNSPQGFIPRHQQPQGPQQVLTPTYVYRPSYSGLPGANRPYLLVGTNPYVGMPMSMGTPYVTGVHSQHGSMAAFPYIQQNGYRLGSDHHTSGVSPQSPHLQTYPIVAPPALYIQHNQLKFTFENTDSSLNMNNQQHMSSDGQTSPEMTNVFVRETKVEDPVETCRDQSVYKDNRYLFYIYHSKLDSVCC